MIIKEDPVKGKLASSTDPAPDEHEIWADLAHRAARQENWIEAIERWQACLDHFPEQAQPEWFSGRGRALLALERFDEAEITLQAMVDRYQKAPGGHVGFARVALCRKDWEAAMVLTS